MKTLICSVSVICLVTLSGCMGGSKAESNLTTACVDLNHATSGREPASEVKNFCACAATIQAKACGPSCETMDGVATYQWTGAMKVDAEINKKCSVKK
jgi:hypothetical protein